jgi:hypothetical protein
MKIDLAYLPAEDRLQLSLENHSDWLISRNLLIKLIKAWVAKLDEIDLPEVGINLGKRDLSQEHALSLEFDGPQKRQGGVTSKQAPQLIQEVTISVNSLGSRLIIKGQEQASTLSLTRKESHLLLEMLVRKARNVNWVDRIEWPQWLGQT